MTDEYSPDHQDEYRRLWHQAEAEVRKARAEVEALRAELAAELAVRTAAREVLEVNDGGPRMYDVSEWDSALDDLRTALAAVEHRDA